MLHFMERSKLLEGQQTAWFAVNAGHATCRLWGETHLPDRNSMNRAGRNLCCPFPGALSSRMQVCAKPVCA